MDLIELIENIVSIKEIDKNDKNINEVTISEDIKLICTEEKGKILCVG